ncbi:MAG: hypothetical protein J7M29_10030, partial [Verrucomicrobia bacterium]|nr:hypothetical protein [Verrucomicrobiota bacterium]
MRKAERPARSRGAAWIAAAVFFAQTSRTADIFLCPPDDARGFRGALGANSYARPMPLEPAAVNALVRSIWRRDPVARLWLLSGVYRLGPWRLPSPPAGVKGAELWLIGTNAPGASPEARPSLICKPPRGGPADRPAGPLWEAWQIRTAAPLERFALIGMTLDANWPEWAATNTAANPSWPGGFKLSALRAAARRGLVRRIRIRNCGANGKIPLPHWTAAGVEAFPLMIEATDYTAGMDPKGTGPGRPAWIVEDVEIRDFHAWHGGYATAVMAKARHPPAELADRFPRRRAVAVRRCQVCGVDSEIGFGSAASAGIACYNDAAINVRLGLNHDTPSPGGLAGMDLTHAGQSAGRGRV